ncbi:hypothetical protein [Intestinicryptomonas porci]
MLVLFRGQYKVQLPVRKTQQHRAFIPFFYVSKPTPIKHHNFYSFATVKEVFSFVLATLGSLPFGKATHSSVVLLSILFYFGLTTERSLRLIKHNSIGLIRFFAFTTYQAT